MHTNLQNSAPLNMVATMAAPYSGATLLAILLGQHPDLSSDGEIFPLGENRSVACSCGQSQVDCPYYRQVAGHLLAPDGRSWDPGQFTPFPSYSPFALVDKALGRMWGSHTLTRAQDLLRSRIPAWRRRDRAFIAAHLHFMENSLRVRQAQIYVDGTKSVRRALLFAGSDRVRMKVLHFIRDGRGFCFSYLKNQKLPRTQLPLAANVWLKNIQAIDRLRARLPHVPVLSVRYEDLCADMPETLDRICRFLEVPYEAGLETRATRSCHVLGNRMRLTFSGQVEECLRWQQEFSTAEIEYLNRELRPSLERFDYSLTPRRRSATPAPDHAECVAQV